MCGACPAGYDGDGKVCNVRRNFCDDRRCEDSLQCVSTDESPFFRCQSCPSGYHSEDGIDCVDIDECYTLRPCDPRVRCTNMSPGFRCDDCPPGFRSVPFDGQSLDRQQCEDINECRDGTGDCGPNSVCVNTEGSYECGCMTGFVKSNTTSGCVQIPGACPDGVTVCDKNAICRSIGGRRYGCKCKVGFAGDGFFCGSDRDLDGWPDQDLRCPSMMCRQDNCPSVPVSGIRRIVAETV